MEAPHTYEDEVAPADQAATGQKGDVGRGLKNGLGEIDGEDIRRDQSQKLLDPVERTWRWRCKEQAYWSPPQALLLSVVCTHWWWSYWNRFLRRTS